MTSSNLAFQMAISLQRIVRSTSCLILGKGFRGRRIEWTYFRLHQIQDGGWPPSLKISNGHISGTSNFVFDPRVGFSGTADRMDLLPVSPNPRWRLLMTSSRNNRCRNFSAKYLGKEAKERDGSNGQPTAKWPWSIDWTWSRWRHVTGWRHNGDVMIFL